LYLQLKLQTCLAAMVLLLSVAAFGQDRIITGTVTASDDKQPMTGVTVVVQGTTKGVSTDIDGKYQVTLSPAENVLVFSFIGFKTFSAEVGDRAVIDVVLQPDVQTLADVAVVGYGTQRKSDLTGSVSSVRGADLTKIPSSSAVQALQGKVSGVQVSSVSGNPGTPPIIRIRGIGTLNDASPIFVVDGVILDDISFLSSSDIESMEVLKDASATSIYGSRGANGVIIVTTKNGKTGNDTATVVNVSAEFSLQHLEKKISLLDGQQFAVLVNEINPGTFNNLSKVANTNWQNEIFRNYVPLHNYHISISGASRNHTYYFGTSFYRQDGIIPNSDYERLSIKFNNTFTIFKNIKVGANITASPDSKNNPADVVATAYRAWPSSVPYNDDGSFAEVLGSGNPLASIAYNNSYQHQMRAVGNFFGELKLLRDFTFKSSFGFDLYYTKDKSFTPAFFVSPAQSNDLSDLSVTLTNYNLWLWENTLNYTKQFGNHHLDLLAGITAQKDKIEHVGGTTQDLIADDPALWYLQAGQVQYTTANNGGEINALASYLFRANYNFKGKYLLTASYRIDGSSKFGVNNRWGSFPSFALGWNIMNEPFMASVSAISNLKLRGSWGVIGNEKIPGDKQHSLVNNDQNAVFGTAENLVQGATYGVSGNPNLKWERTTQTDGGLEVGILNNRLRGEFDYYRKITDGILVDLLTPGDLGNGPYATVAFNAAKVLNSGFELNVSWQDQVGKIKYSIGAIGSTLHNEVLTLGLSPDSNAFIPSGSLGNGQLVTRTVVGQSVGEFYGYQVIGVLQNQNDVESSAIIPGEQPGDLKFADLNGDGTIDDKDRTYIGSYIPTFVYGFNASIGCGNFNLSVDFSGQLGNKIYNGKNAVRPDLYNFESQVADRWHGDGTSNTEPRATAGGINYEPSTYFIQSGSFLRLRSVTLGYTFSPKFTSKLKANQLSVYLRGTNLFTLSKYTGYTPEIGSDNALASGIDGGVYPITSIYSVGMNLSF